MRPSAPSTRSLSVTTRSLSVTTRAPSVRGHSANMLNPTSTAISAARPPTSTAISAARPPITATGPAISAARPPISATRTASTAGGACKQCVSLANTVAALQHEKKTLTESLDDMARHARVLECLGDPEQQASGTSGQEDGDSDRQLNELRDAYAKLQEDFKALRMENKFLRLQVATPLPVIAPVTKKP